MHKLREFFLASFVTLSVFSTDLYLSSFKELKDVFACRVSDIQWSLSIYLIGFAFSMLLCGMLSDCIGRKKTVLSGLLVYFLASLVCMSACSLQAFLIGRFFQAFGGCTTSVISRVIVRDTYQGTKVTSVLSNMFITLSAVLLIAPILGGLIQSEIGWRGHFLFMSGLSFVFFILSLFFLKETCPLKTNFSLLLHDFITKTKEVFSKDEYRKYLYLAVVLWMGFLAFISGSSFLFLDYFKKTPNEFGLIYSMVMSGFMLGNFLAKKNEEYLQTGIFLVSVSSALYIFSFYTDLLYIYILLSFTYMVGVGIVLPIAQEKATSKIQKQISIGFCWIYFAQMLFAAIGIFLINNVLAFPQKTFMLMSLMGGAQLLIFITDRVKPLTNKP